MRNSNYRIILKFRINDDILVLAFSFDMPIINFNNRNSTFHGCDFHMLILIS